MSNKLSVDETAEISMNIIAVAGDAAGLNLLAIRKAVKGNFDEANELLEKASKTLLGVHQSMATILQSEAQGIEPYINTLYVHAQDHFSNSLVYNELSKYIVDLYSQLNELKGGKENEKS